MSKIKTAILGCTGLIGQQFVRMLYGHPEFEISVLSASDGSTGKKFQEAVDWPSDNNLPHHIMNMVLTPTAAEEIAGQDVAVAFSALPGKAADKIEPELARQGIHIFSNAASHRYKPEVPILIPEVNPEHLALLTRRSSQQKGFVITNSNCTTTGLALALKPMEIFGIRSLTVSTFQAISGAGNNGLGSLAITGNVLPYIKGEEEKISRETAKIFGRLNSQGIEPADMKITASCCRVPVRDGHLENVTVELEKDVAIPTLAAALTSFKGVPQDLSLPSAPRNPIILRAEQNRPQPVLDAYAGSPYRARGMAVSVGRLRKTNGQVCFSLLVHNTIRGGAGTCVLNAELALAQNLLRRVA